MATARERSRLPDSEGPPELLDLSFLTDEEREKIEAVLKADEELRTREKIRLGTLRQEYEQARYQQLQFKDKRQCSCCERPFGRLLNKGAPCPACGNRVCKLCRNPSRNPSQKFKCNVCTKKWLIDVQAREYSNITTPATPVVATSSGPLPPLTGTTGSTRPSKCPLYGSVLVQQSLISSSHQNISEVEELPTTGRGGRNPTITSTSSSIVLKYVERSSSRELSSSPSPPPPPQPSLSTQSRQARKLTPDELSSDSEDEKLEELSTAEPSKGGSHHLLLARSGSTESFESMTSIYSAEGGKGDYDISGKVKLGVWYKDGMLFIRVTAARGLAAAKSGGVSDPYVKTYLLPDRSKNSKRKTGIQRKTVNPDYNEILKNKLPRSDLSSRTLWLSVWDWDRFGRNQFLGEVRLPLSSLDLTNTTDRWYDLQDKEDEEENMYRGRLKIAMKFSPQNQQSKSKQKEQKAFDSLFVAVKEADLPKTESQNLIDATVKLYLLPKRSSGTKRKTSVIKDTLNPIWNEEFEYKCVNFEELKSKRVLEVTVWDFDRRGSNDFVGGLRIGSALHFERAESISEEVSIWEEMLACPEQWVERWLDLKSLAVGKHVSKGLGKGVAIRDVQSLSPVEEVTAASSYSNVQTSSDELPSRSSSQEPANPTAIVIEETSVPSKEGTPTIPNVIIDDYEGHLTVKGSHGSLTSLYSTTGIVKGNYAITGEVLLKLEYKGGELVVFVDSAQGLAAADSNGLSDPYIKTYLFPDKSKHSKRKTEIKKKTLNPVYKETLKYKVEKSEFASRILWLSVWDWDRFGRNKFLGEVKLPLSTINLEEESDEHWYSLKDRDDSGQADDGARSDPCHRGELKLGLMFAPTETKGGKTKGTLHISVKGAKSLPKMDESGLTDGFVKLYLLPDKSSKGKRKTAVIKKNLNPDWNETFTYEKVVQEELSMERVLEVTVWDYDRGASNDFMGGLRIGPAPYKVKKHKDWMDSNKEEASQWEEMLARPKEWVECWHSLRSSMDPRDVDDVPPEEEEVERDVRSEEVESVEAATTKGGDISLLEAAHVVAEREEEEEEVEEDEFKKVVVNESMLQKQSVEDKGTVPFQEHKISSLRYHPEGSVEGQNKLPKEEDMHQDVPLLRSSPSDDDSLQSSHMLNAPPPLSKEARETLHASPISQRTSAPLADSPLLKQLKRHDSSSTLGSASSYGSMTSIYSAAGGGRGQYDITGEVLFGVTHVGDELIVHVNRARGLAAAKKQRYSDPYVKTYLLPDKDKSTKKKTSVVKKTINPVFNETLLHTVTEHELTARTLWLSVWDWDRFGRNRFLGEVRLPLSSLDLTDTEDSWYTLQDQDDDARTGVDEFVHGDISVGLMFKPSSSDCTPDGKGTLNICIKSAKNLPEMKATGGTDAVVKCYLLPSRSSIGKRKTGAVKNSLNPVWEKKFIYERVTLMELLKKHVLEITVWDHGKHGNDFIGGLRLGGAPGRSAHHREWMDSLGLEVNHWENMLTQAGEWIEEWHELRPSMDPRKVDLSHSPPPFKMPSTSTPPPANTQTIENRHQETVSEDFHKTQTQESLEDDGRFKFQTVHPAPVVVSPQIPPIAQAHSTPSADSAVHTKSLGASEEPKLKNQDLLLAKRSELLGLKTDSATSFGSVSSIYSAAGGKGDYDISGEVSFGVYYKNGYLVVHIARAQGLAAADSNGSSDPYIKTYLLPDKSKHSKKKTEIKKKTLNPVYDHTMQYKVSSSDLSTRTLWLSVWDWDRFGRNQFLGEVRLPLSSLDLTDSTDHWHTLHDKDESEEDESVFKGEVNIAIKFEEVLNKKGKMKGTLHVLINQAMGLCNPHSKAKADSFVKCYLLPDKSSSGKRKTQVIKSNSNPDFEEEFTYEKIDFDELVSKRVLEVTIWDSNKGSSSDFIGGLRLGPAPTVGVKHKEWMDSIGKEVSHWESVMARRGEWVEMWHSLRSTMNPRSVSLD